MTQHTEETDRIISLVRGKGLFSGAAAIEQYYHDLLEAPVEHKGIIAGIEAEMLRSYAAGLEAAHEILKAALEK